MPMPPQFIPSRKIVIIGTLLTIFIGWLFWVPTTDVFKLKNLALGKKLQALTTTPGEKSAPDSDNDGLKDWEEALWHTDPHNPDTDNDGTTDGEEIKLGRSPTAPAPNDDLKTITLEQAASSTIQTSDNLTESLSIQLMTNFISAKSAGGSIGDLPQKLVDAKMPPPFQDEFTLNDIVISTDNSNSAIKNYINTISTIIWRTPTQNVGALLLAVDKNQDYSLLDKLSADVIIDTYIFQEVRKLKTPSSLSSAHLEIINLTNNERKALPEIQKLNSDPLIAIHGWNEYLNAERRFQDIIRVIGALIENRVFGFSSSDPGYVFKQYKDQLQ
jgi:hypothetical protein